MKKLFILLVVVLLGVPSAAQNFIGLTSLEIKLKMEKKYKEALIQTSMRGDTQKFYLADRTLIYAFKRFYCSSYTEKYKDLSTYRENLRQMNKLYKFESDSKPQIKDALKVYCFYERSKMPDSNYRRILVIYRRYYTVTVKKI